MTDLISQVDTRRGFAACTSSTTEERMTVKINTMAMRVVGFILLLAAGITAVVLNSGRPDASTCQTITGVNQSLGSSGVPSGCGPVNYTAVIVLACVGAGLLVVSLFFKPE